MSRPRSKLKEMPPSFAQLSLQDQLDTITANTRGLVQPERLAVTDQAVQNLLATGIENTLLPVGAPAPAFALHDIRQKIVRSEDLLSLGPVIVNFFRGRWCPYCMTELEAWQRLYPAVRERGALLVAISPQLVRQNDFTVQRHSLTFPILSDPEASVAAAFGAAYTVPEDLRLHYRSILINIPFINGDESWRLPLAATFVIRQDGTIAFAQAHADHRVRPEPQEVLAAL
jgi:peroxiredoxin